MISLLGSRFAPVTLSFGFLEADLIRCADEFESWQQRLGPPSTSRATVDGGIVTALSGLEPLVVPHDRYLFVGTRSCWTALFVNNRQFGDTFSPISYLAERLGTRGLCISASENTINERTRKGVYGSVNFDLYGPQETDWLNRVRGIGAYNDGGTWRFYADGAVLPFEEIESYSTRKIQDRFTDAMLVRYCAALGLAPFDASFYGGEAIMFTLMHDRDAGSAKETYQEAQRRHGIVNEVVK